MTTERGSRRYSLAFWLSFAVACIISNLFEHYLTSQFEAGQSSPVTRTLFALDGIYERLTTAGPRPVTPRFTILVEIAEGVEPAAVGMTNVCAQRAYLARVVRVLRTSPRTPTVIAIDKFFGPESCPTDDEGTRALAKEIVSALESGIGVVLGRALGVGPNDSIRLEPTLDFGGAAHARFKEGILNRPPDVRTLPILWRVRRDGSQDDTTVPSFAFAAATLHRPNLNEAGHLPAADDVDALNVGFLQFDRFERRRVSALALVCGASPPREWRTCVSPPAPADLIGGQVILIGERFRDYDVHATPVGQIPGYVLQAAYIEALLDDHYFRSAPAWVNWSCGLLIVVIFESFFIRHHHPLSVVWRVVVLFLVVLMLAYVLVGLTGFLIAPIVVSVLAIILRLTGLMLKPFEGREAR